LDTFRCPTCVALLIDPYARRCTSCGQALHRRPPRVLGEEHRTGANLLPIDRHMLDRIQGNSKRGIRRRGRTAPPVAWHGRFTTTSQPPGPAPEFAPAEWTPIDVALPSDAESIAAPASPDLDRAVVSYEALEPEVRALVDDLYNQARAELADTIAPESPAARARGGWVPAFVKDPKPRPVKE
jgi:hypothetical protein